MRQFLVTGGEPATRLDASAHYLHAGVVQISLGNLVVIVLMIVVFVLAVLLPFPGRHRRDSDV